MLLTWYTKTSKIILGNIWIYIRLQVHNHRSGSVVKRSPCMREIGVRSPVTTDLSRYLKKELTAPSLSARQQVRVSWVLKDDHCKQITCSTVNVVRLYISLLNDYESRALVKICSPSPVMVTFPYEWKILIQNA